MPMLAGTQTTCFVLMPFALEFTEIYTEVYQAVCLQEDIRCWRVDELANSGPITSDIVNGILDADVIIADLTGQNPNVFYELGIAHAIGKPVILTCQDIQSVPFDIRHNRVLLYNQTISGAKKLKAELSRALNAALEGSAHPSNPVQDVLRLRRPTDSPVGDHPRSGGKMTPSASDAGGNRTSKPLSTRIEEARLDGALARFTAAIMRICDIAETDTMLLITVKESSNLYVQFSAHKRKKLLYGEAVANKYLEGPEKLNSNQIQQLELNGWNRPEKGSAGNFWREWEVNDSHDAKLIALETARTLAEVYGAQALEAVRDFEAERRSD